MDAMDIIGWLKQPADYIKFWIARATEITFEELPKLAQDFADTYEAHHPSVSLDDSVIDYFGELHGLERSGLINIPLNRGNVAQGYGWFLGGRELTGTVTAASESPPVPAASPVAPAQAPEPPKVVMPDPALNLLHFVVRYKGKDYQVPRSNSEDSKNWKDPSNNAVWDGNALLFSNTPWLDNGIRFIEGYTRLENRLLYSRHLYAVIHDKESYNWEQGDYRFPCKPPFHSSKVDSKWWTFHELDNGLSQRHVLIKSNGERMDFELFPPLLDRWSIYGLFQFGLRQPLAPIEAASLDTLYKLGKDEGMIAYGTNEINDFAVHILGGGILPPHFISWVEYEDRGNQTRTYYSPYRPLHYKYDPNDTIFLDRVGGFKFEPYFIVFKGKVPKPDHITRENFRAYLVPNVSYKEMFLQGIAELERIGAIDSTLAANIRGMTYTYDEYVAEVRNGSASAARRAAQGTPPRGTAGSDARRRAGRVGQRHVSRTNVRSTRMFRNVMRGGRNVCRRT